MVRLIEAKQVRARLTLPDDDGITEAIESAIDSALVSLGNVLNTSFELGEVEDVFFIDASCQQAINGLYALRLSQGFVKTTPPVLVTAASDLTALFASPEVVYGAFLRGEKGLLRVDSSLGGHYVRVQYSAGFTELEDAPTWVQEVMIGMATKALSSQQIADGKPELSNVFGALDKHLSSILDPRLRTCSEAIPPLG